MNKEQRPVWKKIQAEKAKDKPDPAKLKKLAKKLTSLDDSELDFTGGSNDKAVPRNNKGKRLYRFMKWESDDGCD